MTNEYKYVPGEPTDEMIHAADSVVELEWSEIKSLWSEMLRAAATQPSPDESDKEAVRNAALDAVSPQILSDERIFELISENFCSSKKSKQEFARAVEREVIKKIKSYPVDIFENGMCKSCIDDKCITGSRCVTLDRARPDSEISRFEDWAKDQPWLLINGLGWSPGSDDYASMRTNAAWAAWQARTSMESDKEAVRNAALDECIRECERIAFDVTDTGIQTGAEICADSIESLKSRPSINVCNQYSGSGEFRKPLSVDPDEYVELGDCPDCLGTGVKPAQPSDSQAESFEDWAIRHGDVDLTRVDISNPKCENGWFPATYLKEATETAWRAYANKSQAKFSDTEIVESFQDAIDAYQDPNQSWGISREYAIATVRSIKAAMRAEREGK